LSRKKKDNASKDQRKNRLFQIRKNKRDEIVNKKRCIGSLSGCPHICVIIPLASDVNSLDLVNQLIKSDSQAMSKITDTGAYALESTRFKSKYNFIMPNPFNINAVLDALKVKKFQASLK
jgi:pre-rRNA-processing protein TSR1